MPKRSQGTGELEGYLGSVSENMDLLHSFLYIKKLSLKLNTCLLASAACKHLFSCAGLLFTAKRARIDSIHFENQLLLKLNRKFLEVKVLEQNSFVFAQATLHNVLCTCSL
ncbi:unnamed protein product [Oncorhynchus mykiss]|uniref:HAT C-terminal dimerisation domain-containing protein n=1 Tax=Oncorhynchus mykiss TaxID=8022 RepID=A0A060Z9Z5_ONCMY|nr:unnamed protein product [Oncorhynchus mykiss]